MIPEGWRKCKIGEIVDIRRGASPRPIHQYLSKTGMPWVKIADATSSDSRYIYKTNEYIVMEGVDKSVLIEPETLIVSNSATPGLPKIMKIKACVHDGWLVFSNYRNVFRDFLYYKFINTQMSLINQANGSVFQNLKTDIVRNFDIFLPPLETQRKIAKVLSAIDDKIELNNSINHNLEQQAQAIFKSWFVDFEPFGGEMPSDWGIRTLDEVSDITAGGDKPTENSKNKNNEFTVPIYSNGVDNEGLYGYTKKAKIKNESITISARGTIGYTCLRLVPYYPIVRLISLEPNKDIITAKYLYFAIKNMNIVGYGTTQQQITIPYCKKQKILLPSKEIIDKFTNIVNTFYVERERNKLTNEALIQLRDTLLPKLMNGEIDVSKVDAFINKL